MTNTLPKGLTEACQRFYRAFDHMPTQIYVNWHRKVHLPPYVNVPLIPRFSLVEALVENDPVIKPSFVSVPFIAASHKSGLEWEDFALYSAKVGKVKPEDLQPSPELVKLILQARGYKVLLRHGPEAGTGKFYIFRYPDVKWMYWEYVELQYTQASCIDVLKAEADYILRYIS